MMSGEYYAIEEVSDTTNFYEDKKGCDRKSADRYVELKNDESKETSQVRLNEIEEQLGMAENRCNTLKEQLDYMKKFYKSGTKPHTAGLFPNKVVNNSTKSRENIHRAPHITNSEDNSGREPDTVNETANKLGSFVIENPRLSRQNSYSIHTDTTGAAVRTINNILSGITSSVNRLSELHTNIDARQPRPDSSKSYRETGCGSDDVVGIEVVKFTPKSTNNRWTGCEKQCITELRDIDTNRADDIRINNSVLTVGATRHSTRKRIRPKNPRLAKNKNSSTSILHKTKSSTADRKGRLTPIRHSLVDIDKCNSSTGKKQKKPVKRLKQPCNNLSPKKFDPENLVELYHNNKAVHGSDSDDSYQKNRVQVHSPLPLCSTPQTCTKLTRAFSSRTDSIPAIADQEGMEYCQGQNQRCGLSPIDERDFIETINVPSRPYTRNYELPTIASKMKQVAKGYMRTFDFRTIPFCAAKSTSPSHNIGINIQQVMSIIKTRQPISGISPTLAHNIGLAADKLQHNPLSTLVSTLGSKLGYGRSQCPLMKQPLNYNQLQEMAKEVPDEQYVGENIGDGHEDARAVQQMMINGPSGDTDLQYGSVWTVDPTTKRTCTCAPMQGVGFQQVLNKYSHTSSRSLNVRPGSRVQRLKPQQIRNPVKFPVNYQVSYPPNYPINYPVQPKQQPVVVEKKLSNIPLKGKEKTLKEVLQNLHEEFEILNGKYEDLNKHLNDGKVEVNNETLKELEKLEKDLNNKEDEINMVMELYKEVVTLKEQVKTLKDKSSVGSIVTQHVMTSRAREQREQNTALHLTKLLRQIQYYQGLYK